MTGPHWTARDPLRPPDWRVGRAATLADMGLAPCPRRDDPVVHDLCRYLEYCRLAEDLPGRRPPPATDRVARVLAIYDETWPDSNAGAQP